MDQHADENTVGYTAQLNQTGSWSAGEGDVLITKPDVDGRVIYTNDAGIDDGGINALSHFYPGKRRGGIA